MQLIPRSTGAPSARALALLSGLAAFALLLVGGSESAHAYPQFQFSTYSATCNMCHFSPSGGGLINGFGRDEAGDTISGKGDGGFLHGAWDPPEWLALGADFRVAAITKPAGDVPTNSVFPMQGDIYARVAFSGLSFNGTLGLRGVARSVQTERNDERGVLDRLSSREHYVMYQNLEDAWYVRAGRFHAPYGIRHQDHTQYVRRYLGQHTLEQTYNLSGGVVKDEYEYHLTAFAPAPVLNLGSSENTTSAPVGTTGYGGAFYYENRNEDQTGSFGAQIKADFGDAQSRYWLGGLYKRFFEDQSLMLMSQFDIGLGTFSGDVDADAQFLLSAHADLTYFVTQGLMLTGTIERYDPDLLLSGSGRDGVGLAVQYMPYAHCEVHLLGRLDFQGEDYAAPTPLGMLMLHYYL
ncbi:hypothetical protein [Haliangium ochraceum]|uniref:Uncharacterized protein n=1 Tax=Haliangium ochraceum (strain DSM 14365 / JCM 11303 / SMP-2) TaxID=502025 RepID=D0LGD2_HALO1|nr:hypothetical protein [Haliangium ochraceum]ACY18157.1 hypothetical protein Hoch_5680 [Haliangium ochraceum DSM 14365]